MFSAKTIQNTFSENLKTKPQAVSTHIPISLTSSDCVRKLCQAHLSCGHVKTHVQALLVGSDCVFKPRTFLGNFDPVFKLFSK